jgi:membrane associated rhomboid family serine protease
VNYPVVGGTALLATAVSLLYWSKAVDISPLVTDFDVGEGQVWRLFTCVFPHGDPIHLVFNVYWLWVLGSLVEETFGHLRTLALIILLGVGSSAAEFALLHGGIGLSGVGYGLVGFLWVLSRRDERFGDAMDPNTLGLFVGWFFLCIFLTAAGAWHVANVAHGAGAVIGAACALPVARQKHRVPSAALLVLLLAACAAGVYARPYVNLTDERGIELARLGYRDLAAGRNDAAVRHLRAALGVSQDNASAWFNLGLAYSRAGRAGEAVDAYRKAVEFQPSDQNATEALRSAEARFQREWDRQREAQSLGNTSAAPATTRSSDTP